MEELSDAEKALQSSQPGSQQPRVAPSTNQEDWDSGKKNLHQPVPSPKEKSDETDTGTERTGGK